MPVRIVCLLSPLSEAFPQKNIPSALCAARDGVMYKSTLTSAALFCPLLCRSCTTNYAACGADRHRTPIRWPRIIAASIFRYALRSNPSCSSRVSISLSQFNTRSIPAALGSTFFRRCTTTNLTDFFCRSASVITFFFLALPVSAAFQNCHQHHESPWPYLRFFFIFSFI